MCMFSGPVVDVSNTQIFVGSQNGTTFTAYGMKVDLDRRTPVAMILPVPASSETIKLVDLSRQADFFEVLNENFALKTRGGGFRSSFGGDFLGYIEVQTLGSYDVSVVPTIKDLDRVNPELLTISQRVKETLTRLYREGFCFVVAVLTTSGKYHPLAYSYASTKDVQFAPTVHEHGDDHGENPTWDHQIFIASQDDVTINAPKGPGTVKVEGITNPTLPAITPRPGERGVMSFKHLARLTVKGQVENMDVTYR